MRIFNFVVKNHFMKAYLHPIQYRHFFYGSLFMLFSLVIGILGYSYFGNLSLIDSLINASMILTGMGPVDRMTSFEGKLFASCYALYSGVAFLTAVGILLGPAIHVFFKKLNME
jgi:hypothetical protein